MKTINLIIGLFLLLNGSAIGQFQLTEMSRPDDYGLSVDSLALMNAYFHRLVDEKQLAGIQTGIISEGKFIHFDSYGFADLEKQKALDKESMFRIFSMTKPIVSVALMQLYDQGKFKLEDPLYQYLPEFKNSQILEDSTLVAATNPIKIVDILRHTSGYNYARSRNPFLDEYYAEADLYSTTTNEAFIKKLSGIPLQFEPGTDWQYGLSTNICGYLVEVLSGQPLDEYLRDSILLPLEMHDTHFQVPTEKVHRFTTGYGWNETDGLTIVENVADSRFVNEVTLFNGGGGLVSTTFDYLKFCQMILNRGTLNSVQILKPETIDLMLRDHLKQTKECQSERLRLPMGEAGFGLGFAIRGENEDTLENVFGWGGAVGTYFKIDTDRNLAYVMMIQLSPYRHLGLRRIFQDYVTASIIE